MLYPSFFIYAEAYSQVWNNHSYLLWFKQCQQQHWTCSCSR